MSKKSACLYCLALGLSIALVGAAKAELVGWWTFDEGTADIAYDFSRYANHGVLTNGATWGTGHSSNSSVQLDGLDDYVEVPHSATLTVDSEVSVMAWINTSRYSASYTSFQGIMAKGDGLRSYSFYIYNIDAAGLLHLSTTSIGTLVGSASSMGVPLNEWVHVCAMVKDGQHQYYINGVDADISFPGGPVAQLPGMNDTAPVRIRGTQEGWTRFLGRIDDARIYNHGLTQQEVQTVVNSSPDGPTMLTETALFIMDQVDVGNIAPELEESLLAKIDAALAALGRDNRNAAMVAMNDLRALVNQVEAQTNKKITADVAAEIIRRANAMIVDLDY